MYSSCVHYTYITGGDNVQQLYIHYIYITGGDDVQQLCEAGEEEFLEIMALVGMASKPLHVRRLQKALQEWVQNPGTKENPSSLKNTPYSFPAPWKPSHPIQLAATRHICPDL
jgi:hypothetical protein